jgi:hypothetical protein
MGGCNTEEREEEVVERISRDFSELLLLTFSGFLDFFSGFLLFVWITLDAELASGVVEENE